MWTPPWIFRNLNGSPDDRLLALPHGPKSGTFWHGTRAAEAIDREGFKLQKPWSTENGWGLYLTDNQELAANYGAVYAVTFSLKKALFLDGATGTSTEWRNALRDITGYDPMHGRWAAVVAERTDDDAPDYTGTAQQKKDKIEANVLWREAMLSRGFDGVMIYGWGGPHTEAVLYTPEVSVTGYRRAR